MAAEVLLPPHVDLPPDLVWRQRAFPNSNYLALRGEVPTLLDSGFVPHAEHTVAVTEEFIGRPDWVVNSHWHCDHVGANALLQAAGTRIAGSPLDATALERIDPGCCAAEYLDQPVPRYSVDRRLEDGETLLLGDSEWQVLAVPGHTLGHLALWCADTGVLAVGDTVSSYDVGWVNLVVDGADAVRRALDSLRRMRALDARLLLPGHGPVVTDAAEALDKGIARLERQRDHVELAVDYGAKRVLAFAVMIRPPMTPSRLEEYLAGAPWVHGAATTLGRSVAEYIGSLVDSMLSVGALELRGGRIHATTPATGVDPRILDLPHPRGWAPDT